MRTISTAIAIVLAAPAIAAAAPGVQVPVALGASEQAPAAGRLIVFAAPVKPDGKADEPVDSSPFEPTGTAVAAREVGRLAPGQAASVDGDSDSFPKPFSQLPPGRYRFQAVLDRNHDYNYAGRSGGDLVSQPVEVTLPGPVPTLVLDQVVPSSSLDEMLARAPQADREELRTALMQAVPVDFVSPRLSAFWGRPIHMRAWIALPPGYDPKSSKTWPTLFETHGFGGNYDSSRFTAASAIRGMRKGDLPPMIWVCLDQSSATGTHEFADSVNNGPWGAALTTELIPWLERTYRMDARPSGRFLNGHSSGGWATLWLQTRYPKIFGGTWSTSPDPSDFHDFTGVDIYRPNGNAYVDAKGEAVPLVRMGGKDIASIREFAGLEQVLGPYGGQFASFDWVFSPRGPDGRPMQLFDRASGAIDPNVAAYWRDNYDIAYRLQRDWRSVGPDLKGKIHVYVGTADTFHLEGSARRLKEVLDRLGANATVEFIPGKTHFDLYERNGDRQALTKDITWQMYSIARPGERRK